MHCLCRVLAECAECVHWLQRLLAQFAQHAALWQAATKAMAELDALMALAYAAQFGGEGAPMCRPTFVQPTATATGAKHVSKSSCHETCMLAGLSMTA